MLCEMNGKQLSVEECDCDECDCDCDLIVSKGSALRTKGVKNRKKVLDEEKYVNQIETIIERDFFPDLPKIRAQIEYRNAIESNDFIKIKSLEDKFRVKSVSNDCQTIVGFGEEPNSPTTFETPLRSDITIDNELNQSIKEQNDIESSDGEKSDSMSLDQFLNRYTSEDNASFEQIQEEEVKKHKSKYKWLYQDVRKQNKSVKDLMELPSIRAQAISDHKVSAAITWPYVNKNSLMYNPSGVALTADEKLKNVRHEQVVHDNTRFKSMPFNERLNQMAIASAAQLQAKQREGKIGIDGKELVSKQSPQMNGFKFVPNTPTPTSFLSAESPLMTWGEICGTPFSLDGSDTPLHPGLTPGTAQFKIPDLPQRDKIGLSLANKAAKQHRDKKKQAIQRVQSSLLSPSSSPSFIGSKTPLEKLNSMSPAAQRLATLRLGLHRNSDHTLLASYSPLRTSVRTPGSTPKTSTQDSPNTPNLVNISNKRVTHSRSDSNQTKRSKASQFF